MNLKNISKSILFVVLIATMLAVLGQRNASVNAMQNEEAKTVENALAELTSIDLSDNNCRFGSSGAIPHHDWSDFMGLGWITTYEVTSSFLPFEGYVPIVRLKASAVTGYTMIPTQDKIATLAAQNPGKTWLIGNEIDVPSQDGMLPEVYARAYHDAYYTIKDVDPTAQVSPAALSMITPGRLQYYDLMWDAYQRLYSTTMPVDLWNIHVYVLAEVGDGGIAIGTDPELALMDGRNGLDTCAQEDVICRAEHDDPDIFAKQVRDMRAWMKEKGQQDKALTISEWSILYPYIVEGNGCFLEDEFGQCFDDNRINTYMDKTVEFLQTAKDPALGNPHDNNRLVQQWIWFSLRYGPEQSGGSSSLLTENYELFQVGDAAGLTAMGHNYIDKINSDPLVRNLHAIAVHGGSGQFDSPGSASGKVVVQFNNNGNTSIDTPVKVSMYSDAALTNEIGSADVATNMFGCGTSPYQAEIEWTNDWPAGRQSFWVKLDSENSIVETNESNSDNVLSGSLIVDPNELFLPSVKNR